MKIRITFFLICVLYINTCPAPTNKYCWSNPNNDIQKNELIELKNFLTSLGKKESNNNWKSYNKHGYFGEFQFGKSALIETGYEHIKYSNFIKKPEIFPPDTQKLVMLKFLRIGYYRHFDNEKFKKIIEDENGITLSGILGGMHLGGGFGVKNYILNNVNRSDVNGTKIGHYVSHFSGYEFNIETIEYAINNFNHLINKYENYN